MFREFLEISLLEPMALQ